MSLTISLDRPLAVPEGKIVGYLAETPIVLSNNGITGLIATYALMLTLARLVQPRWPTPLRAGLAAAWFVALEGAYLLHSYGHIISAREAHAPMDVLHLTLGAQLNIYHNEQVEPQQHIARAAGGPVASGLFTLDAFFTWRMLRRVPLVGGLAQAWLVANATTLGISLIPTPHFDAASLLKWSLVRYTGDEAAADRLTDQAGWATIAGMMMAALILARQKRGRLALAVAGIAAAAVVDLVALRGRLPQ